MIDPKFVGVFESAAALIREEMGEIDLTLNQLGELSTNASFQVHEAVTSLTDLIDHQAGLLTLFGEQLRELGIGPECGLDQVERESMNRELAELMENGKKLSEYMGQALRALQVADMQNQLIDHCQPGMARIEEVGDRIESVVSVQSDDANRLAHDLEVMLEDTRSRLSDERHRKVPQNSVDEGDIEFF